MDIQAVAKKLRELRGDRTQCEVARDLGLSTAAICFYENGARIPEDDIKERIAKYYGMTVGALFFGE